MIAQSDEKGGAGAPPGLLQQTAAVVARQNAMERSCKMLPHGSRLFEVEQGWESAVIRGDAGVAAVDTLLALEAALRDPEKKVILIPLGAMIADGDLEKLCQRNAITKTFFREVRKK